MKYSGNILRENLDILSIYKSFTNDVLSFYHTENFLLHFARGYRIT